MGLNRMETLQAILLALVGAFVGIFIYQRQVPQRQQTRDVVEVVREQPVAPYWTMYSPGYDYWPRWMDSYWLNYVPFYGPITGGSYSQWSGGRHNYLPNHWGGMGHGHSGVAVGGGGGHGGGGGGHH
jgi:hypothetical protein